MTFFWNIYEKRIERYLKNEHIFAIIGHMQPALLKLFISTSLLSNLQIHLYF